MLCVADKRMTRRCYLMLWCTKSGIREDHVERKGNSGTERLNSFVCIYSLIVLYSNNVTVNFFFI